ncbi:unnamed protein product [Caenorhabditis auriculariae]|uniref:Uncharacterized protein n=1 Tax=Caenorhabditis auriculariae TaxID=2777116 RepID=A0A8S1H0K5_9PELO|nr:unnamed protein product [Caenorhabditis auriculariae]
MTLSMTDKHLAMRTCSVVGLTLILLFLFLLGIFLLIPFPIAFFQNIVNSQVYLQKHKDGQFPTATYFWSSLPATQYFTFYFFNVTNPDEVTYNGAKPNLVEVGPYTYAETEFKDFIEFLDNDRTVFFQNNKTWVYDPSRSCADCSYSDVVTLPNAAYMTVVYMKAQQNMSPLIALGADVLTLLLGEAPIRTVSMAGVLFESYPDPFLALVNSNFTKTLLGILGNPIQIPNVPAMGYFPNYNHTNDGNYTIKTGKDKSNNMALIQSWSNLTHLPWWSSDDARDLRNSGDGTFQRPGLQKSDRLKQFQSFTCRHFYLSYSGREESVNGIPAYQFAMEPDTYDSVKQRGYRYENIEKVDYFPNWPCGPNHTRFLDGNCQVDCSAGENLCNRCCNGSYVNGTYLLPQGIVPLRCLPGQLVPLPFAGFLSPPHFLWSPKEVTTSLPGLAPDENKHHPGMFNINPLTGSTVGAIFRMQLSVPIYLSFDFTQASNLANSFLPSFWLEINIEMRDYAVSYIKFNTVALPKIILGVGIALVAITTILLLVGIFIVIRKRRQRIPKQVETVARANTSWSTS